MSQKTEALFLPVIALLIGTSLLFPQVFISLKPFIPIALGMIILSIGLHTSPSSLLPILSRPKSISGLILLRFMIMPSIAFLLAKLCHLSPNETIGLVILGSAPGGLAANVMAYLSGSNVAMTVLLTFGTTILCPFLTPLLIYGLLHQEVQIDFWGIVGHIAVLIFLPITFGAVLNAFQLPMIERIKIWMPSVAILVIGLVIACICALNKTMLLQLPTMVVFAVLLLNLLGYAIGSGFANLLGWGKPYIAAAAFDYGMFDGIVAITICTRFFSTDTAVPTVFMTVVQSVTALMLVRWIKKFNWIQ